MSKDIQLLLFHDPIDSYLYPVYSELLAELENDDHAKFVNILKYNVHWKELDVNHFYDDPFNGTLLDIACRSKNKSEFIKTLIQLDVNINAINHLSKKAPIHIAVENSDTETVSSLVESKTLDINIRDGDGNTPLHIAAKLDRNDIIDILFQHIDLNVNTINLAGHTPLYIALERGNTDTIHLLVQRLDIDMYSQKYQNKHCYQIIKEKYPHIANFIDKNTNLFALLESGKIEEFIQLAKKNSSFLNCNDGQYTYLQFACERELTEVVQTLLVLVKNPNARCAGTDSPLLIAIYNGSDDILKALLKHDNISLEPVRGKNVLHAVIDPVTNWTSDNNQYFHCLQTLLLHKQQRYCEFQTLRQLAINYPDSQGNTILHRAARIRDDRFVKFILQQGAYIGQINNRGDFAVKLLEPLSFRQYLDICISSNGISSRDTNYCIIFDYKMLCPSMPSKPWYKQPIGENAEPGIRSVCETDPLLQMYSVPELRDLLKHPIITSFLDLKWQTISPFFHINFIFHLTFLLLLTLYVYLLCESSRGNATRPSNYTSDRANITLVSTSTQSPNHTTQSQYTNWLWGSSLFFCLLLSIRESCQFVILPRHYTRSLENWFEIGTIVLTATLLLYQSDSSLQQQLGAVAILACGFETVLLLGKHPKLTTYIEMFKTVTWNFSKFLFWYAILIFAFSFSFFILFSKGADESINFFRNPWMSLFKTAIMMTGEFDFQSLPLDDCILGHFIFILFIFLIAIVLLGLLNGLAVSDIQAIRANAEIIGIVSRIKSIIYFESIAVRDPFSRNSYCYPKWLFSIFDKVNFFPNTLPKAKALVFPNKNNAVFQIHSETIYSWRMDPQIVNAAKIILERTENEQSTMETAMHSTQIKDLIDNIGKRNEEMFREIMEILKKKKSNDDY